MNTKHIEIDRPGMRETIITVEEREDGWYSVVSGTNRDGLYSESDDFGPFESAEVAEQEARDYLDAMDEEDYMPVE